MTNYIDNIVKSGLSIYDCVSVDNTELYIPTENLTDILSKALIGLSLNGLPLRTRSKVVKSKICEALGYPIPSSFKRTQPRFPGQNFDVYTQKSMNVQIWNEDVDPERRYVFLRASGDDTITCVKIISGDELAQYDYTGTLTKKYQATMNPYHANRLFSDQDSQTILMWISEENTSLASVNPNSFPKSNQLLPIAEVYNRLLPLVGQSISYINAVQERNRGAELHSLICKSLGYSIYEDDGTYPDIANQLLEVKLQTSPTIDLGLHSPEDCKKITTVGERTFYSHDIRYAIFDSEVSDNKVLLKHLYIVSGTDFIKFFPLFKGKGQNAKLQLPLPSNFFD